MSWVSWLKVDSSIWVPGANTYAYEGCAGNWYDPAPGEFMLWIENTNRKVHFNYGKSSGQASIVSTSGIAMDTWVHVAVVFDNGTLNLYINGQPAVSPVSTGEAAFPLNSENEIRIGAAAYRDEQWLGNIDEFAIYSAEALTQEDIQYIIDNGIFSYTYPPSIYGGGNGTVGEPYLIYTPRQMNTIGANKIDWDKHFKLMADIDLSEYIATQFNVIGIDSDNFFAGVFDGNGHTISNFIHNSLNENEEDVGIFGSVKGQNALIKNLGLIDPDVYSDRGFSVGSLVGFLQSGTVVNCYVEDGSVSADSHVGGLIGINNEIVTSCHAICSVSGGDRLGVVADDSRQARRRAVLEDGSEGISTHGLVLPRFRR